jgi:hypothetical protein
MRGKELRRRVSAAQLVARPYLRWNAFVDLLAMEQYETLSPLQRKAHLVFWYESEVQNGGHGQFLENRGATPIPETIAALDDLGLPEQAALLGRVHSVLSTRGLGTSWATVFEDGELEGLDDTFHACRPSIMEALERHLAEHTAEYVEET